MSRLTVLKACTKCDEVKPLEAFYKEPRSKKDGRQARCKSCQKTYLYAHRKTDAGKKTQRRYNLKYYYGITEHEYSIKLEKQNFVCMICKKPDTIKLAVDHNHSTQQVRGLLCKHCNTILGLVKEDITILQSMVSYLKEYENV